MLHLTQRRGYQSNSTAEAAKDENTGVLRQVLLSNQSLMEEHRYRTVGEMFCKDAKFQVTGPDGRYGERRAILLEIIALLLPVI